MATYYWVGGSGTWNNVNKTNWSTTSGGTGGSGPPTSADTVNFDANSGTAATVTVESTATSLSTTIDKADIIISLSGSPTLCQPTGILTLTTGTINLNGNSLTVGIFSSSNSNTRTLTSSTPANIYLTQSATSGLWVWNILTNTGYTGSNNITVNITGNDSITKIIATGYNSISGNDACNFVIGGNGTTFDLAGDMTVKNLTITNTTCSFSSGYAVTIYGNLTIGGTNPTLGTFYGWNFFSTSSQTITTNGKTLDIDITFNGAGGTWQLQDNLTVGATRTIRLTNGTLDLNGKTLVAGSTFSTGAGTKNITFNGGTLVCPGTTTAFWNANPAGFTTTAGTGTGKISMTGVAAKTFVGRGSTYNCTLENAGAGALTISGNNTFTTISNSVQPTTFKFTAGSTQTVTNFNVSGTAGNLVTIDSTSAGTRATLSDLSGLISVSYCSIKDSNATGGATWRALTTNGSVDAGNNLGWIFALVQGQMMLAFI